MQSSSSSCLFLTMHTFVCIHVGWCPFTLFYHPCVVTPIIKLPWLTFLLNCGLQYLSLDDVCLEFSSAGQSPCCWQRCFCPTLSVGSHPQQPAILGDLVFAKSKSLPITSVVKPSIELQHTPTPSPAFLLHHQDEEDSGDVACPPSLSPKPSSQS